MWSQDNWYLTTPAERVTRQVKAITGWALTFTRLSAEKAGSLPNYGYSSAMKGADFVWDEAN